MSHFERSPVGSGFDAGAFFLHKTIILVILLLSFMVFFIGNMSYAQDLPEFFQHFAAEKAVQRADAQLPSEKITGFLDFSLIHPEKSVTNKMVIALPGKILVLVKDRIEGRRENNYTWIGTVEGRELSTVVMSVVDGSLYGHIDMEGETYSLKPENGAYVITKNDPSTVRTLEDDVMIPTLQSVQSEALRNSVSSSYAFSEDGSAIDVLVLYTQQIQARYGTSLNSKIQNFIDLANTAYAQSGVNTRLRLAHAELYTAAGAAEGVSISNTLQFITNDSQAASLRDTYGADLVSLIRVYDGISSSCGIAWLMTSVSPAFEAYAFSVIEVRSASEAAPPSYYYCDDRTFAHELGHNMGCHHDRAHAGGGAGVFPYSFGYDRAGIFGTIMSYVGPRITYFSTPLISYSGIPIGVDAGHPDAAYNVLSINNTRTTVASFRLADCNFLLNPTTASFGPSEGSGSVTVTASDSNCDWSAKSNVPWVTITSADSATGSGMVTYTVSNNNGSQRTGTLVIAGQTFTITQGRETAPPTGSVVINSGAAATGSASVTLTLDAIDSSGVSQMCISNTTSCSSWVAYAVTKSWTLSWGSGTKTVYVWFRDKWGNQNASPFSASIILDTTAPSNGTVVPTPGDAQVTLNWSGFSDAGSGIGGYKVVFSTGSTAPSSCTMGTPVPGYDGTSPSYTHTGLTNGTTYSYRVCAVDKAGNSSSGATASAKPVPETTPPTGSVVINSGAAATRSASVTLTLDATDSSGVSQMCISNTTSCSSWVAYAVTKSWTLSWGSGTKTVYVWFRDKWGNQNASPFSASIILDTTAPSNGTVVPAPGDARVTLNWSGFSDAGSGIGGYKVVFFRGSIAPSSCTMGTPVPGYDGTSPSYTHTGLTNGTTYSYRVCAVDKAGNSSSGATASAKPVSIP